MTKPLSPKQKFQEIMTSIGGGWYMEKIIKRIPPIGRPKLIKKAQDNEDENKNLYETNRWQNDRKLQLHWQKLE